MSLHGDGDMIEVGLEPGLSRAFAIYTWAAGKLTYHVTINTQTGAIDWRDVKSLTDVSVDGFVRAGRGATAQNFQPPNLRAIDATNGSFIASATPGERIAWSAHGLWFDGVDQCWRAPGIKPWDENSKKDALVGVAVTSSARLPIARSRFASATTGRWSYRARR